MTGMAQQVAEVLIISIRFVKEIKGKVSKFYLLDRIKIKYSDPLIIHDPVPWSNERMFQEKKD